MEPDELAQLEIVVAAPHSVLRSAEDQTARMVARGRRRRASTSSATRAGGCIGSRPGVSADWDRVFEAATAIERRDRDRRRSVAAGLDYDLARRAVDAGCLFALDSDAHSTGELPATRETAIAHARLAGVPDRARSSTAGRWKSCSTGPSRIGNEVRRVPDALAVLRQQLPQVITTAIGR